MIVYLDGRFLPEERASISIRDRGFLSADGVFETALLRNGGFFRLRQHLDRLVESAAALRLPLPPVADLEGIARALARENGVRDANLRFTLSRGAEQPILLVTAVPPDIARIDRAHAGWRVVTARTRRPSMAAAPPQLKTLGRTHALLARIEAADAGADDALLLNDAGAVCEGTSWNVFWRIGDALYTPALDADVLAGVTRAALIELAPMTGLAVHEGIFARADLDAADELLATMTSVGVVTVCELDGRPLPDRRAARALRDAYERLVQDEVNAHPL